MLIPGKWNGWTGWSGSRELDRYSEEGRGGLDENPLERPLNGRQRQLFHKYNEISDTELLGYVELAVDELLKKHPLDLLHRARGSSLRCSAESHIAIVLPYTERDSQFQTPDSRFR